MIGVALDKNRRVVDAVLARQPDEADRLTRELILASWDLMRSAGALPPQS